MKKAISVRDLTKSYKEHEAVKGISFDVNEGEFFAFLGENGAGKSTTINMLCTILSKTSGDVRIFDHELGREDDSIRKLIGIVFQNSVLDNKLTVKENLLTRGAYYGLNKKQVLERMEPFMESFELNEIWNRRYERVDIMRALIHDPRILFLDEPTTGLDPKSRMLVWEHIRRLKNEKNLTIFLTTHYMEETADADNVVILDKGRIIANGTPTKLKTDYASSHLVWYVNKDEKAEEVIKEYDWKYDSDHYSVDFKGQITDLLYRNRDLIRDFEIKKGSMDDVFLNLTGKEFAG